ncbi:hypothetical protein [Candidatus Tisiphia endosymbiont of Sialis lutaria]
MKKHNSSIINNTKYDHKGYRTTIVNSGEVGDVVTSRRLPTITN